MNEEDKRRRVSEIIERAESQLRAIDSVEVTPEHWISWINQEQAQRATAVIHEAFSHLSTEDLRIALDVQAKRCSVRDTN